MADKKAAATKGRVTVPKGMCVCNLAIMCENAANCAKCGWNPESAARESRIAAIQAELEARRQIAEMKLKSQLKQQRSTA